MSSLRSLVREIIKEDLKGFLEKTKDISYEINWISDPLFKQDEHKIAKQQAKQVKRVWASEADHSFMNSLIKIHWLGSGGEWETKLKNFQQLSGKNEISTMGYLPGSEIEGSMGHVGVLVKGRVTFAANTMDALYTGYFSMMSKEDFLPHLSSGVPRRPTTFNVENEDTPKEWMHDYVLDRNSFNEKSDRNEFIVDNWKILGLVISFKKKPLLNRVSWQVKKGYDETYGFEIRLAKSLLEFDLVIYDENMKVIEKQEIEDALIGKFSG